MSNRKDLT